MLKKAIGRNGAERKYDLLTILGAYALSQGKGLQRQTLRLICLITARYNWQHDELSVGQAEIARLWSVDTRTVKREMAVLRDRGWLVEKRAAARGRVTLYGLGTARILEDTRISWEKVGPDLVARLDQAPQSAPEPGNIIPFPQAILPPTDTLWGQVATVLSAEHPAAWRAWFAALSPVAGAEGLVLQAPSGFHANYVSTHLAAMLEATTRRIAPQIRAIEIR